MANNLFADVPAAVVAKSTVSFVAAGFNAGNCRIIYEVGNPLKSWVPDRDINAITGFTAEKGYYIVPAATMDMEAILIPPIPAGGGGSTPAAPTSGVVDDTADTFNWTNNPLYPDLSDYEFTLNGGTSYAVVTAKPIVVGAVSKAIGQVGVRVKAVGGDTASSTLYNGTAFTSGADTDALAYFAAAGITDGTQKSAVNQLVLDLKAATVWTKMKIIYPFVGGDATKHSYNLKNPANFQITWGGTVTHDANGYTGDGSTGYGATGFIPSTDMSAESAYVGVWSKTNASGEYIDIGANDGSGGCFCKTRNASGDLNFRINTGDVAAGVADSIGYFAASQVAGPLSKLYENGSAITPAVNHGDYRTGYALTVGCLNNSGTNYGYSARNIAGIVVGDGLTDAEHTAVYNALAAMQTTLGR